MLPACFIHLSGIGPATAAKLRAAGLDNWEKALDAPELPLAPDKGHDFRRGLEESRRRLTDGDALWFSERLPPAERWRLFPHFGGRAAYVDIETTGLSRDKAVITTIALYDGAGLKSYVRGRNLRDFARDIEAYALLVTWNGLGFDAPFIRRALDAPLRMAHLDLMPVFRRLGLRGGLKKVEKALGLSRAELDGADGLMAVRLWREYESSGLESALETLLAYNAEDVFSLEFLCLYACAALGSALPGALGKAPGKAPFATRPDLGWTKPANPFRADVALLSRLAEAAPFSWYSL